MNIDLRKGLILFVAACLTGCGTPPSSLDPTGTGSNGALVASCAGQRNWTPCDDGNACTRTDYCMNGQCVGSTPVVCGGKDQCHVVGTCDPTTGACSDPNAPDNTACNDGNLCTQKDSCQRGVCVGTQPIPCNAPDDCHNSRCQATTGACVVTAKVDGAYCDSTDHCANAHQCKSGVCSVAITPVPDGRSCGTGLACSAGFCVATVKPATCRQIQLANPQMSFPDGIYTVYPGGAATQVYCDMHTDGGGWTAVFIGKNGSPNVFDHFDTGAYAGTFNDPNSSQYLQRAPSLLGDSASEIAVSCGGAMVGFATTDAARDWLIAGGQSGWALLTPRVLAGTIANLPNWVWTGSGGDHSFIFAKDQGGGGNAFASSYNGSSSFDDCNGQFDQTSQARVFFREAAPTPVLNTPQTALASCLAIENAGQSKGSGNYWLQQGMNAPYQAYCDMTTDGGGWTALFAGRNGSPNVFDHFDANAYSPLCSDPATHCLRQAPPSLGSSAADIAVSCGGSMVRFAMTGAVQNLLVSGAQSGWAPLSPTVIAGTVANLPNWLWTGSGGNYSFIFAKDQGGGGNTFASSYSGSASYDDCNGQSDQASLVRLFYREAAPVPVKNTPQTAGASCRAIHDAGQSQGDGIYWLKQGMSAPYQAYCDMTTDGGGWTAVFAGRNGSVNVFDHFDTGAYTEVCSDPATHCLRRAPASLGDSAADIAVACGNTMVRFAATQAVNGWLSAGAQAGWAPLSPTVIAGTALNLPNWVWTGSGGDQSFVFAKDQGGGGNAFASSYAGSNSFDDCNGVFDQASLVRVFYREAAATPVKNTPGTARPSCLAILQAGQSAGDGIYWLAEPAGTPYPAYCDMTSDGGGWTAVFAGRNGSVNVFDHFDAGAYSPICTDPATHCLRQAPASASSATALGVACGGAMVRFGATAAALGWFTSGVQSGWAPLTPTVVAGSVANPPNWLWTGSGGNGSFIFAKDQGGGGNTFASSYVGSSSYDGCNGVFDQVSIARVFYR